jgi:hypothetical protein
MLLRSSIGPLRHCVKPMIWPPAAAEAARSPSSRQDEQLYEANVSSGRAVVGPPQQRCWVEREQVDKRGSAVVNIRAQSSGV